MSRLMMLIYSIAGPSLAGVGVIAALTIGQDTLQPILIAAAAGLVAAVPISWFVTKQIE